ncbi:MAG: trypsin-like peptidase domain-containing protein [Solirubrobacterales bacterium]
MGRAKLFLRTPFVSALIGGAVVGVFGWVAISAGWVEAESAAPPTAIAPLTAPVVSHDDGDTNLVNQIYRRDGRGVAFIEAKGPVEEPAPLGPFGQPEGGGMATGSGFLIDTDGHIVTNSHVVEGAEQVEVTLGSSDTSYTAEIVGTDPATDIALIKVDAPADQLHPLALGDSSKVQVGDPVVAIGNPFGLDRTVTSGIVSALQRQIQAPNGFAISHVIQTDAAINPGNSGGPLIDTSSRVIGITSQIQTDGSRGNVGIGFAVPVNTARDVVRQLQGSGEVRHAYLGLSGGSITADLAQVLKLPVDEGVLVSEVVPDGPADKAGIEGGTTSATIEGADLLLGGDVITKIDGKKVSGMDEVINLVNAAAAGDKLSVTVLRDDSTETLAVTLGVRPDSVRDTQAPPSR